MTGLAHLLIERTLATRPAIRPRLTSRFESGAPPLAVARTAEAHGPQEDRPRPDPDRAGLDARAARHRTRVERRVVHTEIEDAAFGPPGATPPTLPDGPAERPEVVPEVVPHPDSSAGFEAQGRARPPRTRKGGREAPDPHTTEGGPDHGRPAGRRESRKGLEAEPPREPVPLRTEVGPGPHGPAPDWAQGRKGRPALEGGGRETRPWQKQVEERLLDLVARIGELTPAPRRPHGKPAASSTIHGHGIVEPSRGGRTPAAASDAGSAHGNGSNIPLHPHTRMARRRSPAADGGAAPHPSLRRGVARPDTEVPATIHVTIGRVEVKATAARTEPRRAPPPAGPALSLDSYLRQRNGGRP